jgi:tetratricopeptide (TPR) repeat protein
MPVSSSGGRSVSQASRMRCSSFKSNARRGVCILLLALDSAPSLYRGQTTEQTHAERFAPPIAKLLSAEEGAQTRVRTSPNDPKGWLDLGMAQLRLGKTDEAIRDFRHASALSPSRSAPQTDLAYALWMRGEVDGALAAARAALALDPKDAAAHRYVGRLLLLRGGDRGEAIEHLEKAAQLNPAETDAHFDLLLAYRSKGDPANAWAQLRLLQTEFPEDEPRLLYVHGVLISDQGRSPAAIELFRRAVAGDPHLSEAREALAIELAQNRQWTEALELIQAAIRDNPRSFRLAYAYALTLLNTRHFAEAEEAARQAVDLNPGSPEARALLSEVQAHSASGGGKQP